MNYLDLFAGIGGFALGLQRAGFEFNKHYFSEIDKYAQSIYNRHFPNAVRLGDVRQIGNDLEKINLITGGFPCQSFSIAGKRGGFEDTRGTLFFEIERLAGIYQPKYMVLENVKGLGNHEGGDTIRVILDKLRGLDYSVQLLLLNTKDFGIPQNRERLFFICSLRGQPRPEISSLRERKTEIAFSSNAIDANYYKGIDNHGQRTAVMFTEKRTEEAKKIRKKNMKKGIDYSPRRGKRLVPRNDEIGNCLTGSMTVEHILSDGCIIRKLTPIECERLQGFPDNWTAFGKDNEIISDTQRYKCCGNAVTVKVVEEIAKAIKAVCESKNPQAHRELIGERG